MTDKSRMVQERRKSRRYDVLLRVYFPEFDMHGFASNISLDGCFIEADFVISEGFVTDMFMELPVVGVVALKGYVQRTGMERSGVGVEFVQVRFEPEQSEYFSVYSRFVRLLPQLERIKEEYENKIENGEVAPLIMPPGP